MIPGEIFTGFAKFQWIVSVNDFRFPVWLRELLQDPLCFLRSFCFARILLNPLGGQVLHHDCISVIVPRFTTFTENFVICCNQITKILREVRLRQYVFCTEPLWFWSSGRSRNFSLQGNEYKTLCLPNSTLLAGVGSKDGSWEDLACKSMPLGSLSSTRFSLNSCSHSCMSEWHGSPRTCSWSSFLFYFGFLVGLYNNSSDVSEDHGSLSTCLSTLSLDTIAWGWSAWSISVEDVMGVEVDELEEDLELSISCLKGVMGCWSRHAWGRTLW